MTESNDERRRFFRINDKIGINYKVIDRSIAQGRKAHGDLQNLMAAYDEKLEQILISLQRKETYTIEAIKLLNKKINLLANYLEIERGRIDEMEFIVKNVNISACGLAFMSEEEHSPGTVLEIELMLGGEPTPMVVEGIVIACDKKSSKQHYLRIDFDEIDATDQEALIQYMVKRQSELLRETFNKKQQGDHGVGATH